MNEVYENDNYTIDPSKYADIKPEPGRDYTGEMLQKLAAIKSNSQEQAAS